MNTDVAAWYLAGDGGQPVGPFPAEELIASVGAGRIAANTLCWREGLSGWLPLEQLEPFASAFNRTRAGARRRVVVYALGGALIGLCAGLGAVAVSLYRSEAAMLADAWEFVEEGRYHEAAATLTTSLESTRFHRREAEYLLASARLRQYAASEAKPAASDALDEAAERLRRLFHARPRWRDRARHDLAELMDSIPTGTSDALDRSAALGETLEQIGLPDLAALPEWLEREKQFTGLRDKALEAVGKRDFPAAVARLNEALNIKPDDADIQRRLEDATTEIVREKLSEAEPMVSEGEYAGARLLIAEVEKLDPGNLEASELLRRIDRLIQLASFKEKAGAAIDNSDYDAALSLLRQAVQMARNDGTNSLARETLSGLIEDKVTLSRRLASQHRYADAQTILTEVLRMEPANATAREILDKLDGLIQFADLKRAGAAALEQGRYEQALELLSKASEANPQDEEVGSLAHRARAALMQDWIATAQRAKVERRYSETQRWLDKAMTLDPANQEIENLAKRIDALQDDPETTDLTGVWVPENTHNRFRFTVEGSRVRIEGIPGAGMALSTGKQVRSLHATWQRAGARLAGDVDVIFADGQSAVFEVSATVVSPAILRVRWRDARWDPKRKKWVGHGNTDWRKERGIE